MMLHQGKIYPIGKQQIPRLVFVASPALNQLLFSYAAIQFNKCLLLITCGPGLLALAMLGFQAKIK